MTKRSAVLFSIAVALGIGVALAVAIHSRDAARAAAALTVERGLRSTLASIRSSIDHYRERHGRSPSTLADLVRDGELRQIPTDPVTHSASTWRVVVEEPVNVDDFQATSGASAAAIVEVHSGATGRDSAGRRFSDY